MSPDKPELVELVCLYSSDTSSCPMCVWFIINADVREKCTFTQSATVVVSKLRFQVTGLSGGKIKLPEEPGCCCAKSH